MKAAPWSRLPHSDVGDALTDARSLALVVGGAPRLVEGLLSAPDCAMIAKAQAEWLAHADTMMDAGTPDEVAAFRVRAILAGLGPESDPFTLDTVREAEAILSGEAECKKRVASLPRGMTCGQLLETEFPPPQWIVPDLLVAGLTILAGAPKLGKSWMALALGSAVGCGGAVLGRYRVERRKAVYLALEDTPRRLKARLEKIGASRDSSLELFTQWRSGAEGIADLDAYLTENSKVKLLMIDTLAKFRGTPQGDDRYSEDYRAASAIKALADKHEVAIVVIHHVRKMAAEDIMDTVSGSNGLNGAADSTWILTRARGEADASLFITGRDVEEKSLALRFDGESGTWTVLGDAEEYSQSRERRDVLDVVPMEPLAKKTKDIVTLLGKKPAAVSRLLEKLEAEGLVFSPKYGEWSRRGGKSGNRVNLQEVVKEPEQGTFTLLPDLPLDTPHEEGQVVGLSPEGMARLKEIEGRRIEEDEARARAFLNSPA